MRGMRYRDDDRGAAALMVAIILPALLLIVGAYIVDAGSWYSVRAQTQNGADAGAMAVAKTCAKSTGCDRSVAAAYATANANSSAVTTGFPCGHDPGGVLPACDPARTNGKNCPSTHPTNYVDVQVITNDEVGVFGSLAGRRTKVAACAQATWGPPAGLNGAVALTISACEWLKNTNNGSGFATIPTGGYGAGAPYYTAPPSYLATLGTRRLDADYYDAALGGNYYVKSNLNDPHNPDLNAPVAGSETVITTHGFGNNCAAGNPGWAAPGQFGWLSHTTCTVPISGTTYGGITGNTPAPCGPIFENSRTNKTPIFLPVYTTVADNGSNTTYTLDGFAAFVVTGWDVGGGVNQWNLNGSNVPTRMDSSIELADTSPISSLSAANKVRDAHYCNDFTQRTGSSDVCIYGYFTKALVPASALPTSGGNGTPNDLGITSPYLTG
jgi:hypothetical protein